CSIPEPVALRLARLSQLLLFLVRTRLQPRRQTGRYILCPRAFGWCIDMDRGGAGDGKYLPGGAVTHGDADRVRQLDLASPFRLPDLIRPGIGKRHAKRRADQYDLIDEADLPIC